MTHPQVLSNGEQIALNVGGVRFTTTFMKHLRHFTGSTAPSALDQHLTHVVTHLQVLSNGEQIALNVGGVRFTTSVTTLRNAPSPSFLSAMFSGRHALTPGPDGSIFLDRDGRHFHDVLNYLRDGQLAYPPDGSDYK